MDVGETSTHADQPLLGVVYKRLRQPEEGEVVTEWDWRIVSQGNRRIVATSHNQGFTERNDAAEALRRIRNDIPIVYEDEVEEDE
jgi:hypothetical protein